MKIYRNCLLFFVLCLILPAGVQAQRTLLREYRLPYPSLEADITFVDLDNDGDPDVLRTILADGVPVQWIDDDDDMKESDITGDSDSDCLMIDVNKDGQYGGFGDLIVKRGDEDGDGKADIEVVVDNGNPEQTGWGPGHYMVVVDVDGDGVFNYIDWKDYKLKCWEHSGLSHFFEDYLGNSLFLKIHTSTFNIRNLEYNWENPFLFYDYDNDGVSEGAIRFCDIVNIRPEKERFTMPQDASAVTEEMRHVEFGKNIDWVSMAFDLDNDAAPGNEFDFDMTINFHGGGFDYSDQVHEWKSLTGIRQADKFFYDSRWRKLSRLIYPNHEKAWDLIFKRGRWKSARFVYDEDDDCQRWERVELYDDKDMFIIGPKKGGLDNNNQSDEVGDRGEWDNDNSGGGKLYVSKFDGRIHLYGAEWGCWRIDQDAAFFQGWSRTKKNPKKFPTIKYTDSDNNGFLDTIEYDLDGDKKFEKKVKLTSLGIDDKCEPVDTYKLQYEGLADLHRKVADDLWVRAQEGEAIASSYGIDASAYALLRTPGSVREKYHFGYWLNYYIYQDLIYIARRNKDLELEKTIDKAYYSGNWSTLRK